MNGAHALKQEIVAQCESFAAVGEAILPVGASLDPQPVPGTVGAPLPPAIR
ncbi:MAG: hypothetical protein OXB97_10720 [Rhodospirillales bacterium]|nr:hypothetical protein [Rhodospirillales bacterium]